MCTDKAAWQTDQRVLIHIKTEHSVWGLTFKPLLPCGRYESRLTQCMQSMCTANLHEQHIDIRLPCNWCSWFYNGYRLHGSNQSFEN